MRIVTFKFELTLPVVMRALENTPNFSRNVNKFKGNRKNSQRKPQHDRSMYEF